MRTGSGQATGNARLQLYRNGAHYMELSFIMAEAISESGVGSMSVSESVIVPAGTYTVRLEFGVSVGVSGGMASVTPGTMSWSWSAAGVRQQQYGLDGMMFFYSNHHFHFTEGGGLDGRALPDKWNTPGVLLSASVSISGGFSNWWGAKKHASSTAVKDSAGKYTVYHSIGHTNYQVTASSITANRSYHIVSRGTSSFVIEWRTIGSSPALIDTAFDFQITGNNYN